MNKLTIADVSVILDSSSEQLKRIPMSTLLRMVFDEDYLVAMIQTQVKADHNKAAFASAFASKYGKLCERVYAEIDRRFPVADSDEHPSHPK